MLWHIVHYMVRTTVQISKDTKWRIVLPEIVRKVENLQPGDYIEIDVKKVGGWDCSRITITEGDKNFVKLNPQVVPDAAIMIKPETLYQRLRTFDVKGYKMELTLFYADKTELPDDAETLLYVEDTFLRGRSGLLYKANHGALKQGVLFNKQIEVDDRNALIIVVKSKDGEVIHPEYIKLKFEMDSCVKRQDHF